MCQICDGLTLEESMANDADRIAEHGFTLVGVEGGEHRPWAYTVGLLDSADHPEFVIAGVELETCASLLPTLAKSVLAGERYEVGETINVVKGAARVGAVNEIQYELGTFTVWHNLQSYGAIQTEQLQALQIVMPPTFFCSCHPDAQPRLDDVSARVDGRRPRPNRAERRRYRPRH